MRAVVIETFGGPDVMRTLNLPIPEPGPGQMISGAWRYP